MRRFLLAAALMLCAGVLTAQELFRLTVSDVQTAKALPGMATAQKLFFPDTWSGLEKRLNEKNLSLPVQSVEHLNSQDGFVMTVRGITKPQFVYLLKYKILHPDWTYRENADGSISLNEPGYLVQAAGNDVLTVSRGKVAAGTTVAPSVSCPADAVIHGVFPVSKAMQAEQPMLTGVDQIDLHVLKNTARLQGAVYLKAAKPESVIMRANLFIVGNLTKAAQAGPLTDDHKKAFRAEPTPISGCAVIRFDLSPELADAFFTLLSRLKAAQ